ncbi:hypothetical protein SLE2022_355790 [Rubroshorea leprosula]
MLLVLGLTNWFNPFEFNLMTGTFVIWTKFVQMAVLSFVPGDQGNPLWTVELGLRITDDGPRELSIMARLPLIEGGPAKNVSKRSRVEETGDSTTGNTERRIELPADLFCPIMEWLPLVDVFRASRLSRLELYSSASSVLSSKSYTRFLKSPWLLLPPKQHGEGGYTS